MWLAKLGLICVEEHHLRDVSLLNESLSQGISFWLLASGKISLSLHILKMTMMILVLRVFIDNW